MQFELRLRRRDKTGDELTPTAQETFDSRVRAVTSRQHSVLVWFVLQEQHGKTMTSQGPKAGMHWRGGGTPPPPSRAPSLCPATVPLTASAGLTDSNRPQPLWQPPPTAWPTAAGAASEVPSLRMHSYPKAAVREGSPTAGMGCPPGRTRPMARAVALLRVGLAQSSETGADQGLRWHNLPRKQKGVLGGEDGPGRERGGHQRVRADGRCYLRRKGFMERTSGIE